MDAEDVYDRVPAETVRTTADELWENPELSLQESRSADGLVEQLRSDGFSVERGVAGLPTAFVAEYGVGSPVVGIIAEYDALPDFSQKRTTVEEQYSSGGPGHACGHNLFAAGSLGGAIATKHALADSGLEGTIVLFGCPAEEILVGKTFMVREGLFDRVDAALSWHAGDLTWARLDSSRALNSLFFAYEGTPAHTRAPMEGRSALDAVQLLNTGVEYMREHIPDTARVSSVITNGGSNPGTVPATAGVWYYVRAPTRTEVNQVTEWLTDIAEAAATMTQTECKQRFLSGCHRTVHNRTLAESIHKHLQRVGPIKHDPSERRFGDDLSDTVPDQTARQRIEGETVGLSDEQREAILSRPLHTEPLDTFNEKRTPSSSTDIGDVSKVVPLGRFRAATWPVGVAPHTWQAVAASGTLGKQGAIFAAKVLAGTAVELFESSETLATVQNEFEHAVDSDQYQTPIPPGTDPPFDMTDTLFNA